VENIVDPRYCCSSDERFLCMISPILSSDRSGSVTRVAQLREAESSQEQLAIRHIRLEGMTWISWWGYYSSHTVTPSIDQHFDLSAEALSSEI
jgi:hypothetical protein